MSSFKDEILHAFPFLFKEWGFEFIDLDNDYGGNVVVAQSDTMRIRFVHDRADFSSDIGQSAEPSKWKEIYKILDVLKTKGRVRSGYKYSNKIHPASRLLELYFSEIQDVIVSEQEPS